MLIEKGVCDLYMHGAIESTTKEVHCAFKEALNTSLDIQNKLYNLMKEKGWYQTECADSLKKLAKLNKNFKINSIKTKQSTIVDCFLYL